MLVQNVKVDSKGRIIIPNSFRETLGIKSGENIEALLDKENERIMLFPIEKKTQKLVIQFGDAPGSLAKAAALLAKNKVDLVYTASRSLKRKKEAEWEIIADFSNTDVAKLKKELKNENGIKHFRFEKLQK
jgi:AbrB family looped-hinge helix DNA binding protein